MTEEIKCPNCSGTIKINPDFLPEFAKIRCPYCDYRFNSRRVLTSKENLT
jgi:DNA-directed RNA polymerase subunit RPC12/RpoP